MSILRRNGSGEGQNVAYVFIKLCGAYMYIPAVALALLRRTHLVRSRKVFALLC